MSHVCTHHIAALILLSVKVTGPTSRLVIEWGVLTPDALGSITPIAFRFSSAVTTVPMLRFGLQEGSSQSSSRMQGCPQ